MGGFGSGPQARRKLTVDESLTVSIDVLRECIVPYASGKITWTRDNVQQSAIGFNFTVQQSGLILTLHYHREGETKDTFVGIRMQSTPTSFGGSRLWFTCPLIVNGIPCNRRVGNLHLPPSARYFGCRTCHNLTYRSCQRSHVIERIYLQMAKLADKYSN